MDGAGTVTSESAALDEAPARTTHVKLFAFLIAIAAVGGLVLWLYRSVRELEHGVADVGRLTRTRRKRPRVRIVVKRRS